jgi:CDP-glycerol glycerophosphotransferase
MAREAEGVANVTSAAWTDAHTLRVEGYAYIKFVSDGRQQIELVATEQRTGTVVTLPAERIASEEAARYAADTTSAHDADGFRCDVDVAALRTRSSAPNAEWSFSARITDDQVVRTVELDKIWRGGSTVVVGARLVDETTLAQVRTDTGQPLRVRFERAEVVASAVEVDGDRVTVRLAPTAAGVSGLRFAGGHAQPDIPGERSGDVYTAALPPAHRSGPTTWRLFATAGLRRIPVVAGSVDLVGGSGSNASGLRAIATRDGHVAIQVLRPSLVVDSARVTADGAVELAGSLFGVTDELEVGVAPGTGRPETWHAVTVANGRFDARIPLVRADLFGSVRPLMSGAYQFGARRKNAGDSADELPALVSDAAAAGMPATYLSESLKVKLVRRTRDRLGADISAPVPDAVLGRYAQAKLIERYGTSPRELEDAVFFIVDMGSNASDTALALHHELRRRGSSLGLYWGVEDLSVPVPEGGTAILKRSEEWFAKLNGSRFIVNNYGGVWGLTKDPHQRYLQTWHGTPYKYIGVSEARHKNAANSRLENIAKEASEWDALVSPSPYFSALAAPELFFNGTLLETGYPRNDRLANADPDERARLRTLFGIPESANALLYAPTYREGQRHGWKAALFEGLDLERLLSLLGPDWYVLLRGHSFNARDDHADRSRSRLIDVTRHRDVNDLYLASDALVTDYSSVMFDYAVTGRPMAFFTPDLKKYVAARGVYFDLAEHAPGPLAEDVVELAEHLRDLDALAAGYREKYTAFRDKFAPWDDGKAAARVVDAFFE